MTGGLRQADIDGLQAAAVLLAGRGTAAVRAEELARATGMSVGALYRRHGDKEGFVAAVRGLAEEELAATGSAAWRFSWNPASSRSTEYRCAFLTVWHALGGWAVAQPALFSFTFLHHHASELETGRGASGQVRELLREVLETGLSQQAVRSTSAWVLVGLVWGTMLELVRAAHARGERLDDQELSMAGEALWGAIRRAPGVSASARTCGPDATAPASHAGAEGEPCDTAPVADGRPAPAEPSDSPGGADRGAGATPGLQLGDAAATLDRPRDEVAAALERGAVQRALDDAAAWAGRGDSPAARAEALASWTPCCPCAARLRPQASVASRAPGAPGRSAGPGRAFAQEATPPELAPEPDDGAGEPPMNPARAEALAFHAAWKWGMWVEPEVILGHMAALGFDPDCEADVQRAHAEVDRGALDFDFVQRWCISHVHVQHDRQWARVRQLRESTGGVMSWAEALERTRAAASGAATSTLEATEDPGLLAGSPVTSPGSVATDLEAADIGSSTVREVPDMGTPVERAAADHRAS